MTINLTQNFLYETDSSGNFEKVLDTIVRVMYDEKPSDYSQMFVTKIPTSFNDGKEWMNEKSTKPKYLYVCSVGDNKSSIKEGDETFENYADLVQKVMKNLKNADSKKFLEECGDGYTGWFNHFNGSIDVGYRLSHHLIGGANILDISLCHIYYGK